MEKQHTKIWTMFRNEYVGHMPKMGQIERKKNNLKNA